jgi:hypothetical protein
LKIGLDDYLCKHSIEEFKHLPVNEIRKLTITEEINNINSNEPDIYDIKRLTQRIAGIQSESEKNIHIQKLSEKTGIPIRNIQKDIKAFTKERGEDESRPELCASFLGLIDIALNDKGNEVFLIKEGNSLLIKKSHNIREDKYEPPPRKNLPFALPLAGEVLKWYQSDDDSQIFEDLLSYFRRFSYLPDDLWLIVACATFLSYIQDHNDIHYLPIILFWAVPERGKSRTGKAMSYVNFRGIHLVDLREANLFRYSEYLKATLFFDIMNLWKKTERNNVEDILLQRYEKGAKTARVLYPEKGPFNDTVHYSVYGATILATNEPVHKILDTRCILITMPNKPGSYENPSIPKAQPLKERLTAWRARVLDNPLTEIDAISGLSGRLWDISKPLLQVCNSVYPDGFDRLKNTLLEIAGQKLEDKKESIEGQIVTILDDLSPDDIPEWTIKNQDILEKLNKTRPEKNQLTPQYLGRKLKAMGIKKRIVHGYSEITLDRVEFNTLLMQFGIIDTPYPPETLPNPTTLKNQEITTGSTGRELIESQDSQDNSLPEKSIKKQEYLSLVESGRELTQGSEEEKNEVIEVIEFIE